MPSIVLKSFAFLCVLSPFFLGADKAHSDSPESMVTVQFSNEPNQYDPLYMEDGVGLQLGSNTVGTLYAYDSSGILQKALVDEATVTQHRKKYSFRFKKNLKWSDGMPFKVQDFIFALKRLNDEPVRPIFSGVFPKIDMKNTRVVDSNTVEVVLVEPDAFFLDWLTLGAFAPIRPEMVETLAQKHSPVVPTLAAYQVEEYKRDEHLILRKNPNFFGAAGVKLDSVKILFIRDEAALLPLLKSKKVDVLTRVPVLQMSEVEAIARLERVPVNAITYIAMNTRKAPFDELKNRLAFRRSMNERKSDLVKVLLTGELAAYFFLPEVLWSAPLQAFSESPAEKVAEKIEFSLQSDLSSRNQAILEFTQSVLKKKLSWNVKLDLMEFKAHYSKLRTEPDQAWRFGWQNPIGDPALMYQVFVSDSPNNFTGWKNDEYDRLVTELKKETLAVKRAGLIPKIESILAKEAPVVPLLQQVSRFACSKRVLGFRANPFGVILFRELRLIEDKTKTN